MASNIPEITTEVLGVVNSGLPVSQDTVKAAFGKYNLTLEQVIAITDQFNILIPETIKTVPDMDGLREIVPSAISQTTVRTLANGNNDFKWNDTNDDVDDNYRIIKPNSFVQDVDVGRWVRTGKAGLYPHISEAGGESSNPALNSAPVFNNFFNEAFLGKDPGSRSMNVSGTYYITPGEVVFSNFNSSVLQGIGNGFINKLFAFDETEGALITIDTGNPNNAAFSSIFDRLSFFLENGVGQGALYFANSNILDLTNIYIKDVGVDGYGISNAIDDNLFQEIYIRRLEMNATGSNIPARSYGLKVYPTGNIELSHCNIEAVETVVYARYQRQASLFINGGHFERNIVFLDVDGAEVTVNGVELASGVIWLGSSCHSGYLKINKGSTDIITRQGFIDNGFGNEFKVSAHLLRNNNGFPIMGLNKTGKEWLYVRTREDNPIFLNAISGWVSSTSPAVSTTKTILMSAPTTNGRALSFKGDAGCYKEKEYEVDPGEYVLGIGIAYSSNIADGSMNNVKIEVRDGGDALIYTGSLIDSGITTSRAGSSFTFFKKLIPSTATGIYKVRIIQTEADKYAIIPLVVLSKSDITSSDYNLAQISSTDVDVEGTTKYNASLTSGEQLRIDVPANSVGRAIVRFRASTTSSAIYFSADDDYNDESAYSVLKLFGNEEREYTMVLPKYPSQLRFYTFSDLGAIYASTTITGLTLTGTAGTGIYKITIAGQDSASFSVTNTDSFDTIYNAIKTAINSGSTGGKWTATYTNGSNVLTITADDYIIARDGNGVTMSNVSGDLTLTIPTIANTSGFVGNEVLTLSDVSVHYLPFDESSSGGGDILQTTKMLQKNNSFFKTLGTDGSNNNKKIFSIKMPDISGYFACEVLMMAQNDDYYKATVFLRKNSGTVFAEKIDVTLNDNARFSLALVKISNTEYELQASNTRTSSFATIFYEPYTYLNSKIEY